MALKLKALVTAEVIREELEKKFSDRVEFVYDGYILERETMPTDELAKRIAGFDILISEYETVSREVFEAADRLKFVICCRGGVKTVIDLEAAKAKGVMVCNNAGRNAAAVGDMAMALILDLTRNVTLTNGLIHSGVLSKNATRKPDGYADTVWGLGKDSPIMIYRGRSVCHMTLGIVGLGAAGKALAHHAAEFGMKIIASSLPKDFADCDFPVESVTFDELLRRADVVSVHCPLLPETRDMFDAKAFAAMKPDAYFVNTSRGGMVVEEDLVATLMAGRLAGAALDVTRQEPIPADSPLIGCPRLILTPHLSGSADDVQICGTEMTAASLAAYLDGREPPHRVA